MAHIARVVIGLLKGDDAQDLIEYALLIGLVALVAIVGVTTVGTVVSDVLWKTVSSGLSGAL